MVTQDCAGLPSSQSVSQPCCLERGIDACGANLFCAAFDGRKQPTCYAERSRLDMTECTEDRQCTSGACNVEEKMCRSAPRAVCTSAIGCASVDGKRAVCKAERCVVTDGSIGSACAADGDCTNGVCDSTGRCVGAAGATCKENYADQCAEGLCCKHGKCGDCRAGQGEACGFFLNECQPGLVCCPFAGSGSYCYPSCN